MKKIIIAIIVIVVGIGTYYIFSNNSYKTPMDTSSNTPQTVNNQDVTVSIKNFSFNPLTLAVKTGAKVTWTNNDVVVHTVTSDSGNLLDSPTLSPGQSFSFTFTSADSFDYHCSVHPAMKGAIIIK